MLVKILDAPIDLVDRLKASTGMATASKAFLLAAQQHDILKQKTADQELEIETLRERLEQAESVIASARSLRERIEHANSYISARRSVHLADLEKDAPGRKPSPSLKDLGDWFDAQGALDFPDREQPDDRENR